MYKYIISLAAFREVQCLLHKLTHLHLKNGQDAKSSTRLLTSERLAGDALFHNACTKLKTVCDKTVRCQATKPYFIEVNRFLGCQK